MCYRRAPWSPLVLILAAVLGATALRPAAACLLAHRLRVVAPHLTEEEVALYAHGNMLHEKIHYRLAAATPCINGRADIFDCDGVDLLGHLNLSEIGGGGGNDLWGWTDPATGIEYAIIGRTNGTAFIDLSDPETPVFVGNLPSHSGSSSWRDIKTFADHAFIVADGQPHGIQVFDLTQLRGVLNPPVTFGETAHFDQIGNAHNIVINEATGIAYAVGSNACQGGLYMVDVNTPTVPTFVGCFDDDGYTHDAQCIVYDGPDAQHTGKEICFASNEDTLTIVDVTNKANPVQLSRTRYLPPGSQQYAHQGWLTEDRRFFIFDDEFDELGGGHNTRTYVWDVGNLEDPQVTGFFDAAGRSIDHNQYVRGNFTYQANYTRGLRILELTDPANAQLVEAGFLDTHPERDGNGFSGAWSTFPFFDSGVILVSDINRGLFIVRRQSDGSNTPPTVRIDAPTDGASFVSGTAISFTGSADDAEDGDVSAGLAWTSSLDGSLGSGSAFSATLSVGTHQVTAAATDTGGLAGTDAVTVRVTPAPGGCAADVDFEAGAAGWSNSSASTCSTGSFVIGTPTEVIAGGVTTQVAGDHTTGAGNAFFSAVNSAAGTDDIDGGTCIVESPVYAVAEASDVAVWYFHGQRDAGSDTGDFFRLEMSVDAGTSFTSLVAIGDVTSNAQWTRVTAQVAAGANVRFRLQAADGPGGGDLIEAGIDDVSICANDGGNAPPAVAITAPADGTSVTVGTAITFRGTAADSEDGDLAAALAWRSSLDGPIGTGAAVAISSLSVGVHAVTASVTDSSGSSASDQIAVSITQPPTGGCLHEVDFEAGAGGWSGAGSTCTTGSFVVGTPDATTWQVGGGNPGQAFFTAPNAGGIGSDDVDGGTCEARSPLIDARGEASVEVALDFFHGQRDAGDDAGDGFTIEILSDGAVVDTLVTLGDSTSNPAWSSVSSVIANPGEIQIRVRATDAGGGGDIVEGGVDNVRICRAAPQPTCSVVEDFEAGATGWINAAVSTCTSGSFVVATPTEQNDGGVTTQVGGDHTSGSGRALFTATNTTAGSDDVDGGTCVLTSPVFDVVDASDLSIWTFHGQRDAGDDVGDFFRLELSIDAGANWTALTATGDVTSNAAWTEVTAAVAAGDQVQIRLQVADGAAGGDLIEAGVDDLTICPR